MAHWEDMQSELFSIECRWMYYRCILWQESSFVFTEMNFGLSGYNRMKCRKAVMEKEISYELLSFG